MWKIVLIDLAILMLFLLWLRSRRKGETLHRQAVTIGWTVIGTTRDDLDRRQLLLTRAGLSARICTAERLVYVDEPWSAGPFQDFLSLEERLARPPSPADTSRRAGNA